MSLNPRLTDWSGQVCWLVGASTGIGRATAEQLHAAGATVIVSARNVAALQEFAQAHARGEALPMDTTDREAVHAAARRIIEKHGRIDLVMYCAGHYKAQRATAYDLDEMLKHQHINVTGAYLVLDAVLMAVRRRRPRRTLIHSDQGSQYGSDAWRRFSDEGYRHYQVVFPGFKYNMMDLQAAIGVHQLSRVETNWLRRREIGPRGAVLVRPDRFIAWRSLGAAADPAAALGRALAQVLGR